MILFPQALFSLQRSELSLLSKTGFACNPTLSGMGNLFLSRLMDWYVYSPKTQAWKAVNSAQERKK